MVAEDMNASFFQELDDRVRRQRPAFYASQPGSAVVVAEAGKGGGGLCERPEGFTIERGVGSDIVNKVTGEADEIGLSLDGEMNGLSDVAERGVAGIVEIGKMGEAQRGGAVVPEGNAGVGGPKDLAMEQGNGKGGPGGAEADKKLPATDHCAFGPGLKFRALGAGDMAGHVAHVFEDGLTAAGLNVGDEAHGGAGGVAPEGHEPDLSGIGIQALDHGDEVSGNSIDGYRENALGLETHSDKTDRSGFGGDGFSDVEVGKKGQGVFAVGRTF